LYVPTSVCILKPVSLYNHDGESSNLTSTFISHMYLSSSANTKLSCLSSFLSFFSFFASLTNLSFSLRASFWARFSSAFFSLASFASCFLFSVFALSAAYAWKVSARCTVPDPSGRDVLVELEAV
jgi:hypothetical protein